MNDLRKRLLFLLGALIVFRVGAHIPVPGVDAAALVQSLERSNGNAGILGMLNLFSGGSLERFSIFAIGIMPYISASIIIQLVAEVLPSLKTLKKEGEAGRRTLTKYTRWGTLLLGTMQAFFAAALVYQQPGIVIIGQIEFFVSAIVCLVTGTMFLMWLGEQMTERGIGNGISLLITAGIVAALPRALGNLLDLARGGSVGAMLFVLLGSLCLIYIVVYIESAQRKIPVHYARRQIGNRVIQGQKTHLPFKINMAGVIPPIFASSIILFPSQVIGWLDNRTEGSYLINFFTTNLAPGKPLYIALFALAIIFFCYFYTALVFSPREMAENLKKSGAFVPGIRPGEQTSNYLERVVMRLTFFGALYITIICLIPEFVTGILGIPFHLGGTSLLILVVVTMDFGIQVASYRMNQQYEHLMRKKSSRKSLS